MLSRRDADLLGHSPLCLLLDRPTRRRGLPFVCICGKDSANNAPSNLTKER